MNDYSNIPIIYPNFPHLYHLADGRWQQIWELQLSDEQTTDQDFTSIQEMLSNEEIEVNIIKKDRIIHVEFTTIRWQLDDDLIVYSWKMFEVLNTRIHGIDSIQGQSKEVWVRSLRKKRATFRGEQE